MLDIPVKHKEEGPYIIVKKMSFRSCATIPRNQSYHTTCHRHQGAVVGLRALLSRAPPKKGRKSWTLVSRNTCRTIGRIAEKQVRRLDRALACHIDLVSIGEGVGLTSLYGICRRSRIRDIHRSKRAGGFRKSQRPVAQVQQQAGARCEVRGGIV